MSSVSGNSSIKKEDMDNAVDGLLSVVDGDRGRLEVLAKMARSKLYSTKKEGGSVRYITEEELVWMCYYILTGLDYNDALKEVSKDPKALKSVCERPHKPSILNKLYDAATETYKTEFDVLKKQGLLYKSNYKGKSRPSSGLKVIQKAVRNQQERYYLEEELSKVSDKLEEVEAKALLNSANIENIQDILNIELTDSQKVSILLKNGKSNKFIADILSISTSKVSKIKNQLNLD